MKPALKILLPVAAVAIVGGGWFGLSAYASKEADRRISSWLYKNDLDTFVRYRSVKASPFGSSATLQAVEIVIGGADALDDPPVRIAQLSIADLRDDDQVKSGTLSLKQVSFSEPIVGGASGVRATGRTSLAPVDLRLFAKLGVEKGELELRSEFDAPDMIAQNMQLTLGGLRGIDDVVGDIRRMMMAFVGTAGGQGDDLFGEEAEMMLRMFGGESGQRGFRPENVTLTNLDFTIRDQGAFRRQAAIRNRYEIPLDPAAGDAAKQRKKAAEQRLERELLDCEKQMRSGGEPAIAYCQALARLLAGDSKGMRLRVRPDDRVRLTDFIANLQAASKEQEARMIRRLNLQVESL